MITALVVLVAATAAAGLVGAFAVRRLRRLSRQLTALAVFAVVLPLVSVSLSGGVMLHAHDAFEVLVLSCVAACVAGVVAVLIARGITRPLRSVHGAVTQIASGDLATRLDVTGPTELSELAVAFNEMAASVQHTFDARRDFIAWASHDLRAPVAALQAMIEAIGEDIAPAERYLPTIRERISDLAGLVEDLFDLACIELTSASPTEHVTDAVAVAQRAVATHQPQAAAQSITVAVHADLPELPVRCAPTDLARVLDNLLGNALHHTPPGGRIAINLARNVTITVTDSGPGFPPDALDRVFEPFWRADLARHSTGAGLGLAIALGLVQRNGGTITASNAPGAQLSITLPPGQNADLPAAALKDAS